MSFKQDYNCYECFYYHECWGIEEPEYCIRKEGSSC